MTSSVSPPKPGLRSHRLLSIGVLAIAVAGAALFGYRSQQHPSSDGISATVLEPARPLPDFSLIDDRGEAFSGAALAGAWSLLFFGFTHCPDICPPTLQALAETHRVLGQDGDARQPVRIIFVSVDPARDTPETLRQYLTGFAAPIKGVTGPPDAIADLARSLGIFHEAVRDGAMNAAQIAHGGSVLLVDPQVRLRAVFSAPHLPSRMARDIAAIEDL